VQLYRALLCARLSRASERVSEEFTIPRARARARARARVCVCARVTRARMHTRASGRDLFFTLVFILLPTDEIRVRTSRSIKLEAIALARVTENHRLNIFRIQHDLRLHGHVTYVNPRGGKL